MSCQVNICKYITVITINNSNVFGVCVFTVSQEYQGTFDFSLSYSQARLPASECWSSVFARSGSSWSDDRTFKALFSQMRQCLTSSARSVLCSLGWVDGGGLGWQFPFSPSDVFLLFGGPRLNMCTVYFMQAQGQLKWHFTEVMMVFALPAGVMVPISSLDHHSLRFA